MTNNSNLGSNPGSSSPAPTKPTRGLDKDFKPDAKTKGKTKHKTETVMPMTATMKRRALKKKSNLDKVR